MTLWTYASFEEACLGLIQAFGKMEASALPAWELVETTAIQQGHQRLLYLKRRHQARVNQTDQNYQEKLLPASPLTACDTCRDQNVPDHGNDDNNLLHVDPDVIPNVCAQQEKGHDNAETWVWHFSVVYSETWQTPVLYFLVHDEVQGQPCSRTRIVNHLATLHPTSNEQVVTDSWDFVSQEEHPVTGIPSFFLHPCQSNHLLEHVSKDGSSRNNSHALRLLQWMTIMLPSVGLPISSKVFVHVSTVLQEDATK